MVNMICDIDPVFKKFVLTNKRTGKKKLYGKLTKAVYGTLLGAILFYHKLSDQLYKWGYKQNPYDPCTFNKMVNDEQLTIQFHVDDLRCSHMEQKVWDDLVKDLNNVFQTNKKELVETKGDIHKYLGLTIDFSGKYNLDEPNKPGQFIFTMFDYIEDIVASAPPDMRGISPDLAKSKLFEVHDILPRLNIRETDKFHSTTARLLFAAKRARPDIQVAVAYLCTRVREPIRDGYMKLARMIQYLYSTLYLPLVTGWNASGTLLWSINASFAVHNDMRSHTGAMLTFERGAVFSLSNKQKVNTTSSNVAEIVGVDDVMNFVM